MFRKEAVESNRSKAYGELIVRDFPLIRYVNVFLILLIVSRFILSVFIPYQKKQTLPGWVEPKSGYFKVKAPRSGTIHQLMVDENGFISQGETLFEIDTAKNILGEETLEDQLEREIRSQINNVNHQIQLSSSQHQLVQAEIKRLLVVRDKQRQLVEQQLSTMRQRGELITQRISTVEELEDLGHMSTLEIDGLRDLSLAVQSDILRIEQEQLTNTEKIGTLRAQLTTNLTAHEQQI